MVQPPKPLKKHCIFCGRPPVEKNKEHVVPRWLIKLTGDPKRAVRLGFNKQHAKDASERVFSFDQFTFPACEACNMKYSDLEVDAKNAMAILLEGREISATELSRLMDWFDKVRVGLWLGFRQLDKNLLGVEPSFYIEQRIGQFDRLLIIERYETNSQRLNFSGTESPAFGYMPSAFSLTVNGLQFTNVSTQYLLARRLGFPFPAELSFVPDRVELLGDFIPGRERIMRPVLKRPLAEKGVVLYQPMFPNGLLSEPSSLHKSLYESEYVRLHSLNYEAGEGAIFMESPNKEISVLGAGDKTVIDPKARYGTEEQLIRAVINMCEWQDWLIKDGISIDRLPRDQQKFVRSQQRVGLKCNEVLINHHRKLLKNRGYIK